MSTPLPTAEDAYAMLFRDVHEQVFFRKCAAAGFVPRTEAEAVTMLNIAGKLRAVSENSQVKAAGAQDNALVQMDAGLDRWLADNGFGPSVPEDVGFRKAAAELAADPAVYNAVLALKAEEANNAKAQYEAWAAAQK